MFPYQRNRQSMQITLCSYKGQREPRDYCALNYGRYYEPVGPHTAEIIPCTCIRHCSHVSSLPVSTSYTSGTILSGLGRPLANLFSHHHLRGTIRIQRSSMAGGGPREPVPPQRATPVP